MITTIPPKSITTLQFLNDIHGPDAHIYFNVGGKTWKNKPQTYSEAESKLKWLNDQEQKDIYFIPNGGGTTNDKINSINAVFADWDAGKTANGDYFDLSIIQEKKTAFLLLLETSPLLPSYIIDTRNGFHLYWLVYSVSTIEQFITAQKLIINYYKTDPVVINPARVMRLPGYYWYKPEKNLPSYFVDIIVYNQVRYSIVDIIDSFSVISAEENHISYPSHNTSQTKNKVVISAQVNNLYNKNTLAIYLGTYPQDSLSNATSPEQNIIDQLKRMNLAEYLNIKYEGDITIDHSIDLRCLFHDDTSPSARIYLDKNGYYQYYCHSSSCGFKGSIIDVVMEQDKCAIGEAISKLIEHYHISDDPKWVEQQKQIITHNMEIIYNLNEYQEKYPDLCRTIGRIKQDLLSKLQYAQEHLSLKTRNNENIIICSLKKFQQLVSPYTNINDHGRQNERIDRYCLLGLMRKLHDNEVNHAILSRAYAIRNKIVESKNKVNGKLTNLCRVQFYSIPEYTEELLQNANNIAKSLRNQGVRMNAISRDVVLQIFGKEEALRIYPQILTEEVSDKGKYLMDRIETMILDDLQAVGYSSVKQIVERIHTFDKWKTVTDRRVKRYIPGLLKKHGWVEQIASKELKNQLGIGTKGYPKVIVRNGTITIDTKLAI